MKVDNPYINTKEVDHKLAVQITQILRFKALNKLLKGGLPNEEGDRNYFLQLLKACDQTTLAAKKLENDKILAEAQLETFNIVTTALSKISKNPFLSDDSNVEDVEVPIYKREEGEDYIGIDNLEPDT